MPAVVVLLAAFVTPMLTFVVYAFLEGGSFEVTGTATLGNLDAALHNELARTLLVNAAVVAAFTATACVLVGVPLAYVLRFRAGRLEYPLLFVVLLTMFASYLARIYAWRLILGSDGLLQSLADPIGLGRPELLFTKTAVVLALVHIYLPFVVLVVYAALRNVPAAILDLSADLGASPLRRFVGVVVPLVATSIAASFLYVLVLAASDYVTPQLLGGSGAQMVGVLVQSEFTRQGNYPGGAALALLLLVCFLVLYALVALVLRLFRLDRVSVRY